MSKYKAKQSNFSLDFYHLLVIYMLHMLHGSYLSAVRAEPTLLPYILPSFCLLTRRLRHFSERGCPMAKSLPPRPSLDQLKHQARDLQKACHAGDVEAIRRIQTHHPRYIVKFHADPVKVKVSLQEAQLVVAREYGFTSWPKLVKAVRPTILVADREASIRALLEEHFERQGYAAISAATSQEIMSHLGNPQVSVLVLDYNVDRDQGLRTLEYLRNRYPNLPVIYTCSFAPAAIDMAVSALHLGCFDYLVKPYDMLEIIKRIDRAIDQIPAAGIS